MPLEAKDVRTNADIIDIVATKLMRWHREPCPVENCGQFHAWYSDDKGTTPSSYQWNPLDKDYDRTQVEDKLFELGYTIQYIHRNVENQFLFCCANQESGDISDTLVQSGRFATRGQAVIDCTMKIIGMLYPQCFECGMDMVKHSNGVTWECPNCHAQSGRS